MRQPRELVGGPIHSGAVVVPVRAIDVGGQRSPRGIGLGILEERRRRAGNQIQQVLIIPVLVQRQVGDVLGSEVHADVGLVSL